MARLAVFKAGEVMDGRKIEAQLWEKTQSEPQTRRLRPSMTVLKTPSCDR